MKSRVSPTFSFANSYKDSRYSEEAHSKAGYKIITNSGGGDCGIYSVMHAMWGKQNSDSIQAPIIRNQLAEVMSRFVDLYRYRESLDDLINIDFVEVIRLYQKIFSDPSEGFTRFKFVTLETIIAPLLDESINQESKENRKKAAITLESINNWEDLSRGENKDLIVYLFRDVCSDFGIDVRAAISDHNAESKIVLDPETCTSEEYKAYVSHPGIWLDNNELAGYLLSQGYLQCSTKSGRDIGSLGGSVVEFKNASGEFVRLHNNAVDFDAGNMSQATGDHWQGAVEEGEHGAGSSEIIPTNSNGANLYLPELDLDAGNGDSFEETLSKILKQPTNYGHKEKSQVLQEMSRSYVAALERYRKGDLKNAETEFVKVIRPVLSKSLMKEVLLESGDADKGAKLEILDSMYHLGLIYESGGLGYTNHWAKSAGIFMYCNAFMKKHQLEEELEDRDLYLKAASCVEGKFLNSGNDAELLEQEFQSYREDIAKYKARLEGARDIAKSGLEEIKDLGIEKIDIRANGISLLYEQLSLSLVTKEGGGLLQQLISKCHEQLGGVPQGCEYSIFGLGSLSIGTITPWSDIEFGILINQNMEEYKEYFRKLTQLLQIKIINLGESQLRGFGIESLNNFKTADELDDWFWDDVTSSGMSFDGAQWHACKSPLGRKGYKAVRKEKDANGVDINIMEEKPDYELIGTLEEMVSFQNDAKEGEHSVNFSTDKHLVQSLRRVSLIEGSQDLLDGYRDSVSKTTTPEIFKIRELEILKEDLEKFSLKLGDKEEGKLLDVKKDMYRLGDRILVSLANYYGIDAGNQEPHISIWQIIERMRTREEPILGEEGSRHLSEAISIAAELRLSAYSYNEGQLEGMSTYIPAVDHLDEVRRKELVEKTFHIKDTDILHHFYYVMIPLQDLIGGFCLGEAGDITKLTLKNYPLLNDNSYVRGMVHARFLEYNQALNCMERAEQVEPKNKYLLIDKFFLYRKTGQIKDAITVAQKILEFQQETYKFNSNHPSVAASYNNLGNAYNSIAEYNKSIENHTEALRIRQLEAYSSGCLPAEVASSFNNLGTAYAHRGEYDEALKYFENALKVYQEIYRSNPDHPCIAVSYNNLGSIYKFKAEYDKAIKNHIKALCIRIKVHKATPNHPSIAASLDSISTIYGFKGEYDEASVYHRKAFDIYQKVHENSPAHLDIADSYSNLGDICRSRGEFDGAIKNHDKALKIRLTVCGSTTNHPKVASSYNNFGTIYESMGQYDSALKYHYKAMKIYEAVYETNPCHPDIASSHENIGSTYRFMGEYDKALKHARKALDMYQSIYKSNSCHPDIASSNNTIGLIYASSGEYGEALKYHKRALEIYKEVCKTSPNHPGIPPTYGALGSIYKLKGEHYKALEHYLITLSMHKKVYGNSSNHPDIASSYNNLGVVYESMDKYSEAIENHKKSLNIKLEVYKTNLNHPDIAASHDNLGNAYCSAEQFYKALECYKTSLDIYKKVYKTSPNHPSIASSYNNIGVALFEKKAYLEAIENHKKSFNIRLEAYKTNPNHPDIATSLNNLGVVYNAHGKHLKAEECHKSALKIRLEAYRDSLGHPDIAVSYSNLGKAYHSLGAYEKALSFQEKAMEKRENLDMKYCAKLLTYAGASATELKMYTKAKELYTESLIYFRSYYDSAMQTVGHPEISKSLNDLGCVYYLLGDIRNSLKCYMEAFFIISKFPDNQHFDFIRESLKSISNLFALGVGLDEGLVLKVVMDIAEMSNLEDYNKNLLVHSSKSTDTVYNYLLPLHLGGDISKNMLEKALDRCYMEVCVGEIKLWLAIVEGDVNAIQELKGVNLDKISFMELSPLIYAIVNGKLELAKALVHAGASINHSDNQGATPLYYSLGFARQEVNLNIVEFLLASGADANISMNDGDTPMHMAHYVGNIGAIRLLLEHHADMNLQEQEGKTPLHYLLGREGVDEQIKLVIIKEFASEYDFSIADSDGKTALDYARQYCEGAVEFISNESHLREGFIPEEIQDLLDGNLLTLAGNAATTEIFD